MLHSGFYMSRIWDTTTGVEINKLEGHSEGVLSIAMSEDGKTIVSSSSDMTIR